MFGLLRLQGCLKAKSPIHHGGNEKTGSVVLLNRLKFIVDGEPVDIPYISGNAVRGVLRRHIMADMLEQLDYEIDVSKKGGQKLYHALFSGGVLETVEETQGAIDIELKRKILNLLPPIRLFGFSYGNQMVEGKLKIGHLLPICTELKDYLPDNIQPKNSFYDYIGHVFQTRKDELRVEKTDEEQAIQMLIEYEVFVPGTMFWHEIKLEDPTPLDVATLARVIELWKQKPFIGGKSAIGHGELTIRYDFAPDSKQYEQWFNPKQYLEFLKERRDEICKLLDNLSR